MPSTPTGRLAPALGYLSLVRLLLISLERFVYPFLPAIARGLDVSLGQAGLLLTARSVGGFSTPLTVATGGRHGHHQRLMVVALGLFATGSLLAVGPATYVAALAGFALLGAARPAYDAAAQAYLSDRTPYRRRGRVLAVLELMYAGGLLVGAPAAGWLIARYGWRSPFLVAAALAVVAAVLVRRWLEPTRPHEHATAPPLRHGRDTIALLVVMALFAFGAEVTLVVLGAWLEGGFGLSLLALGGVSTVIGAAELTGEGLMLVAADRIGKRRSMALGMVIAAVAFGALPFLDGSLPTGLGAFAVALLGFEIAIVAAIPLASELRPLARSRFLALGAVAMMAGRAVAAAVGPALFDAGGIGANAIASATAYATALIVLFVAVQDPRP